MTEDAEVPKREERLETDELDDTPLLERLKDRLGGDADDELERKYLERVASPDYVSELRAAARLLLAEPEDFQVGDVVEWKPGLRNRFWPGEGAPAVVLSVTPGRVSEEVDPGSIRFREPVDLELGIIDGDGDLFVYHFDRRRFTHWRQG